MYESYKLMKITVVDRLATVTINRPEARNALNPQLLREIQTIWSDLADDDRVNAILFTAEGKYFSVGGDVKMMADRPGGDIVEEGETLSPMRRSPFPRNMIDLEKPVVCAIHGDCVGHPATIALCCDVIVMADTARIGAPFTKLGIVAGDGSAMIWPLLVGVNRAKEYLMRGTLLNGVEAERIGLVNHVRPQEDVIETARTIAQELANAAPAAVQWTKRAMNQAIRTQMNLVHDYSNALERITLLMEDHREGTLAFKEKRRPVFKGR